MLVESGQLGVLFSAQVLKSLGPEDRKRGILFDQQLQQGTMFGNLLHLPLLDLQGQLNKPLIIWCVVCKTVCFLTCETHVLQLYSTRIQLFSV